MMPRRRRHRPRGGLGRCAFTDAEDVGNKQVRLDDAGVDLIGSHVGVHALAGKGLESAQAAVDVALAMSIEAGPTEAA